MSENLHMGTESVPETSENHILTQRFVRENFFLQDIQPMGRLATQTRLQSVIRTKDKITFAPLSVINYALCGALYKKFFGK